jgi:hypothetical protein
MKEEQHPGADNGDRKRQTIHIRVPRKPAAPRSTMKPATTIPGVHAPNTAEPVKVHDLPLRIISLVIVALLILVCCHFFFEFIRCLPLQDFLPAILWPQMVHKLLGIALLLGFGFFETTRKGLPPRSRWAYCTLLAFGVSLFAVQWIPRSRWAYCTLLAFGVSLFAVQWIVRW